jgi:hypothetical protein
VKEVLKNRLSRYARKSEESQRKARQQKLGALLRARKQEHLEDNRLKLYAYARKDKQSLLRPRAHDGNSLSPRHLRGIPSVNRVNCRFNRLQAHLLKTLLGDQHLNQAGPSVLHLST